MIDAELSCVVGSPVGNNPDDATTDRRMACANGSGARSEIIYAAKECERKRKKGRKREESPRTYTYTHIVATNLIKP